MRAHKSRLGTPFRPPVGRCTPSVEPLESRRLRTATPDPGAVVAPAADGSLLTLDVVQTSPAAGGVWTQSPTSLEITFNQPFDPFSLGQDIGLDRVDAKGVATPLDPSLLNEPTALTDPTATLSVTLGQTLTSGHYRIVLLGSSLLTNADDGASLPNPGVDQTLADFTIAAPGPALKDAIDLGTIGATPEVQAGTLDLAANLGNYALYKVDLAPGHFWRLGTEVSAQRDGGTLASALALFDANGHVINSSQVGLPDAPNDPYLFEGLKPGTYYVGISAAGDLPGTSAGYDPVAGVSGAPRTLAQAGGPFRLHLVADPADTPTRLSALTLDQADPASPTPTGFTLQFDGALRFGLDTSTLSQPGHAPVEVVDAQGTSWPLAAATFDESAARISYVFAAPLPAGDYTVRLPERHSLIDLAGLTPVAAGEPAGVLGTFTIASAAVPSSNDPGNFGIIPLTPGADESGTSRETHLDPGTTTTQRFVIEFPGFYDVKVTPTTAALVVGLTDASGSALSPAGPDSNQALLLYYQPGVYFVHVKDNGATPVEVTTAIKLDLVNFASFLDNGVGQGPALNLRLISPPPPPAPAPPALTSSTTASLSSTTAVAAPVTISTLFDSAPVPATSTVVLAAPSLALPDGASVVAITASSAPSTAGLHASSSPSTSNPGSGPPLVLNLGGVLTGAPNPHAEQVANVGPMLPSGVLAVSASSVGLLQPLHESRGTTSWEIDSGRLVPAPSDVQVAAGTNGALITPTRPDPIGIDLVAEVSTGWLPEIEGLLAVWSPDTSGTESGVDSGPPAERFPMLRDDLLPESRTVQRADLSVPLGVGVLATLGYRLRRPLLKWLYRRSASPVSLLPSRPMAIRNGKRSRVSPHV